MAKRTPLYDAHISAGAKIVDFGGWDMPLHYGSQKDEHHAVRSGVGVFDVSHMTIVDIDGEDSKAFLRVLLANDVARLTVPGTALYSCMLNERGGVIDDLIVYWLGDDSYRMVVNAATREKDLEWLHKQAGAFTVGINERPELAMIAVQGPNARETALKLMKDCDEAATLKPFSATQCGALFVARTGYTGEDGFEIVGPADAIRELWSALLNAGAKPAGLGARDTLRLEAAMNLYGNDMDESVSPYEAGLGWTLSMEPADRQFIGRAALEDGNRSQKRFVGLLLEGKGVLRSHQRVVIDGEADGEITSGGFSPTLNRSIALARLPAGTQTTAHVEIRGKLQAVRIVRPPFVRHGTIKIDL